MGHVNMVSESGRKGKVEYLISRSVEEWLTE